MCRHAGLLVVFGCVGVLVLAPPTASAMVQPTPLNEGVAIDGAGVVWIDEHQMRFTRFLRPRSFTRPAPDSERATLASSAGAVATTSGGEPTRFVVGDPPGRLTPIAQPPSVRSPECVGWEPGTAADADFVLAGDELVAAGECEREELELGSPAPARQPVFGRDIRGGRWRVLRWIPGKQPPLLAADGSSSAIGVQQSPEHTEVLVIDTATGRLRARFKVDDGYLGFASPTRLVLAVPVAGRTGDQTWPLPPVEEEGSSVSESEPPESSFRLELYSTIGVHLGGLGTVTGRPLVSNMHLLLHENGRVSVRSLKGRRARPVIGFEPPARSLLAGTALRACAHARDGCTPGAT